MVAFKKYTALAQLLRITAKQMHVCVCSPMRRSYDDFHVVSIINYLFSVASVPKAVELITEFVRFPVDFVAFIEVELVRFILVGGMLVCANARLR
jgi:hypothetical protein